MQLKSLKLEQNTIPQKIYTSIVFKILELKLNNETENNN